MTGPSPEKLWEQWRAYIAQRFDEQATDLRRFGGGPKVYTHDQRLIAAEAWTEAARMIRNAPPPPYEGGPA